MTAVPRLVVSAPSSGHGKTAVAVGLLAAFAASGLRAAGFKVGPDHTDAAYLGLAAGRRGRNLDPRLVGPQRIAPLFAHGAAGADVAVVEGTMGLFDSLAGRSEADSTAGVAGLLRAPVVLVVDVAAIGQSVAALVHGFRSYDELVWLGGVILNRVASDRHEQLLREALEEIGVPVLGALRRGDLAAGGSAPLPPRHQGVVPVLHRTVEATRAVRRLGEAVAGAVDLDRLLSLARSAPRTSVDAWSPGEETADSRPPLVGPGGFGRAGDGGHGRGPVVALAGVSGAAYGYAETAELLAAAGAEIVAVDPLRDETLPDDADALVVCGGLPEAYLEELSANARLCMAVADLARSGRPVVAEGAGLLWLAREFDGRPMCGVIDATGATTDRMVVGYREATARASSPLAPAGARVVGYKQHRGAVTPRAGQSPAWSWGGASPEGFVWRRVHASQLTLHWAGTPEIAGRLVAAAMGGANGGAGGHGPGAAGAGAGYGGQGGSPVGAAAGVGAGRAAGGAAGSPAEPLASSAGPPASPPAPLAPVAGFSTAGAPGQRAGSAGLPTEPGVGLTGGPIAGSPAGSGPGQPGGSMPRVGPEHGSPTDGGPGMPADSGPSVGSRAPGPRPPVGPAPGQGFPPVPAPPAGPAPPRMARDDDEATLAALRGPTMAQPTVRGPGVPQAGLASDFPTGLRVEYLDDRAEPAYGELVHSEQPFGERAYGEPVYGEPVYGDFGPGPGHGDVGRPGAGHGDANRPGPGHGDFGSGGPGHGDFDRAAPGHDEFGRATSSRGEPAHAAPPSPARPPAPADHGGTDR